MHTTRFTRGFDYAELLLGLKRVAVGTFYHGGICFMSADVDLRKRTVILRFAVISALGNGAADALVCVHLSHLTFCDIDFSIC